MSEAYSTPPARPGKPGKPYPAFPLTAHPAGSWCKKIRGKLHYFGPWDDPDGAIKKYLEQKDALHAGRKPREDTGELTVKDLCNRFLNAKLALVESGELAERSWNDYKAACNLCVARLGRNRRVADLGPDDFAAMRTWMAKRW